MLVSRSSYSLLPKRPGVYLFLDAKGDIIYVGKAINLKNRVSSYFLSKNLGPKTSLLVSKIDKIKTIIVASEIESLLLEANLVKKHQPFFNVKLTDDKSYLLTKITLNDKYPKVLTVRRQDDNPPSGGSIYFGPYPNASSLKLVLRTIRGIFPFQSTYNHPNKLCFYHHLGLCLCPPLLKSQRARIAYRQNIKYIIRFLKGDFKKIIKDLEDEREKLIKSEDFEKAMAVQKKIETIKISLTPYHYPTEYEINPNLSTDILKHELSDLEKFLVRNSVKLSSLKRIECYDVSNIGGEQSVGSMVVFVNGVKRSDLYKRFKIRGNLRQNDYQMLKEIVERRLKHQEWPLPNLLVVDGGKGQVSIIKKLLNENSISIPVIGLAKREEIMITSDFKEIRLPKNSGAFHLIVRIRDEAHRFALWYHKKLRSRATFV